MYRKVCVYMYAAIDLQIKVGPDLGRISYNLPPPLQVRKKFPFNSLQRAKGCSTAYICRHCGKNVGQFAGHLNSGSFWPLSVLMRQLSSLNPGHSPDIYIYIYIYVGKLWLRPIKHRTRIERTIETKIWFIFFAFFYDTLGSQGPGINCDYCRTCIDHYVRIYRLLREEVVLLPMQITLDQNRTMLYNVVYSFIQQQL
jgi:hypothetical protein